jgi:hypothetical protein
MEMNYPHRMEMFEVVMIRRSTSEFEAKPADYKRVAVEASEPLQAMLDDKVQAEGKDWRPMCATKPGVYTDPEVNARRREMEGPPVDRSKL